MKRSKNFEKRKKFIMELLGDPLYKPMRLREIASLLQLDKSEKKELFDVLDELCAQGKAEVDNKGRYSKISGKRRDRRKNKEALKAEKPERDRKGRERREKNHEEYRFSEKDGTLMEGTFIGHYKGFGFVEVEDQEQDIFIPENDTGSAMHQDKVQILVRNGHKEGKRQEGVVLKVLERGMPSIVGTYQSSRDYGFVISDNPKFSKDIFISRKNSMGAKDGDKVVAEITDYGSRNRKPEGKITEQKPNSPTLAMNTIGRHISKMVYTKVVTNKSPWLAGAELGGVYTNPASHGEGRFVASKEWIDKLMANGQIATRYCDVNGNLTNDEYWNVNGSYCGIEGITSPDGRVFGKMAHAERRDNGVAVNIYGEQDLKIFESGVAYFK